MFISIIKKIIWKITCFNNLEKYAAKKGVHMGVGNSFVDNPNFGSEPYLVYMGNNNRISFGCVFLTHDGGRWVLDNLYPEESPFLKFGTITIGNNNFIGCRCIINPNVSIGDNCIIAAGSVVTKNIPSGEVHGGVPAKFIMTTEDYYLKLRNNKDNFNIEALHKNRTKEIMRVFNVE